MFAFPLLLLVLLVTAVIATRTKGETDPTMPTLDEHGYLIPAAGPRSERRGSLVVDRQLAGV